MLSETPPGAAPSNHPVLRARARRRSGGRSVLLPNWRDEQVRASGV
eukprot:SAG31_NODE_28907_length_403_cov_2.052632_2_plen_45_part_01